MKLLAGVLLVVAAGAVGWFLAQPSEHAVSLGLPQPRTPVAAAQSTGRLPSGRSFEVWLARDGRVVEALRTHKPTRRVASAALAALLAGPTQSERASGLTTAIPGDTRLNGVTIANGVARVDLTSDFESAAGSRALQLRLAQVVYTLTQFPTVKAVQFSLDGSPVSIVSGNGNVVGHAVGRDDYRGLAPVASPLAGNWRRLPRSPFGALTSRASAWTGKELLLLGRAAGARTVFAAYAPGQGWRRALTASRPGQVVPRRLDRPRADRLGLDRGRVQPGERPLAVPSEPAGRGAAEADGLDRARADRLDISRRGRLPAARRLAQLAEGSARRRLRVDRQGADRRLRGLRCLVFAGSRLAPAATASASPAEGSRCLGW